MVSGKLFSLVLTVEVNNHSHMVLPEEDAAEW